MMNKKADKNTQYRSASWTFQQKPWDTLSNKPTRAISHKEEIRKVLKFETSAGTLAYDLLKNFQHHSEIRKHSSCEAGRESCKGERMIVKNGKSQTWR